MAHLPAVSANITNRSPWLVQVRYSPTMERRFSYPEKDAAQAYCDSLSAQGLKAKLVQMKNAFQLRVRRKGVKQQMFTFSTWQAAEQARLKIYADLSVSIVRDYAKATQFSLRDLLVRYRDEVVPLHKGRGPETSRINKLLRDEIWLDKKLAALTTEDLKDFIDERLSQVMPATVDRDLDIISQTMNYADNVWKIAPAESPFKGLPRPKYFNERDRRLGDMIVDGRKTKEETALLNAARADNNPFIEPAIILALETAMRRSELLSLTFRDINVEQRYAFLKDTKNGRSRKVPLTKRALQVIHDLGVKGAAPDQRLLGLTDNALKIAFFRRVLPASKVQDFRFHDLRHEATSRLAESGKFQLIELQAITGHRDMRMLQRYAHLCAGKLAQKMDEAFEKKIEVKYHRGRKRTVVKAGGTFDYKPGRRNADEKADVPVQIRCGTSVTAGSNVVMFPKLKTAGKRTA